MVLCGGGGGHACSEGGGGQDLLYPCTTKRVSLQVEEKQRGDGEKEISDWVDPLAFSEGRAQVGCLQRLAKERRFTLNSLPNARARASSRLQ